MREAMLRLVQKAADGISVVGAAIDEHLMIAQEGEFRRKVDHVLSRIGHGTEVAEHTPVITGEQRGDSKVGGGGTNPFIASPFSGKKKSE